MNAFERHSSEETRARILEAAWDLFRELGTRVTIADVAERLGMSSANIYRFYASKQALSDAVCAHQLGRLIQVAEEIAARRESAAARIRAILITLYRVMRDQMVSKDRVHEIVEVAIQQRWAPIEAYEQEICGILSALIAEGQTAGEFGPGEPTLLGANALCACSGIHHPLLIALYDQPEAKLKPDEIVEFALRALMNRQPAAGG